MRIRFNTSVTVALVLTLAGCGKGKSHTTDLASLRECRTIGLINLAVRAGTLVWNKENDPIPNNEQLALQIGAAHMESFTGIIRTKYATRIRDLPLLAQSDGYQGIRAKSYYCNQCCEPWLPPVLADRYTSVRVFFTKKPYCSPSQSVGLVRLTSATAQEISAALGLDGLLDVQAHYYFSASTNLDLYVYTAAQVYSGRTGKTIWEYQGEHSSWNSTGIMDSRLIQEATGRATEATLKALSDDTGQ